MIKKYDISIIIIYTATAFFLVLKNNEKIMYLPFVITIFAYLIKNLKNKHDDLIEFLCIIAVYSAIMPDNYTIIGVSFIMLIIYFIQFLKNRNKVNYSLIFVLIIFIANIAMSGTKAVNILFYIIFNFTFIIYYLIFKSRKDDDKFKAEIARHSNNIIIIETLTTVFRVILQFNIVRVSLGSDWSTGTLGVSQGNILMFIFTFNTIRYIEEYQKSKSKKLIILIILSVLVILSTASIANNLVLLIAIIIYTLFNYKINMKTRIVYVMFTIISIFVFYSISPEWVKGDIKNLTDVNYIQTRIKKVNSYNEVFINIPKNNTGFLLFGNGAGYYSSRAALTCTGKYIEGYNKFFTSSISEYTYTNVYRNIIAEEYNRGVEEAPYSTIISIMGEFGVIGLIAFFIFFLKVLKQVKQEKRLIIIFFIGMCFIDNWIEFAKVVFFLWFTIFY